MDEKISIYNIQKHLFKVSWFLFQDVGVSFLINQIQLKYQMMNDIKNVFKFIRVFKRYDVVGSTS